MPGFAANNGSGCSSQKAIFRKCEPGKTWKIALVLGKILLRAFLGALQFLDQGHYAKLLLL